jgi:hypothetical protein
LVRRACGSPSAVADPTSRRAGIDRAQPYGGGPVDQQVGGQRAPATRLGRAQHQIGPSACPASHPTGGSSAVGGDLSAPSRRQIRRPAASSQTRSANLPALDGLPPPLDIADDDHGDAIVGEGGPRSAKTSRRNTRYGRGVGVVELSHGLRVEARNTCSQLCVWTRAAAR